MFSTAEIMCCSVCYLKVTVGAHKTKTTQTASAAGLQIELDTIKNIKLVLFSLQQIEQINFDAILI